MQMNLRSVDVNHDRAAELRKMLEARRNALAWDVREGVVRDSLDISHRAEGLDMAECAEADIQQELSLTLLRIKRESLAKIDDALQRLDAGEFGSCTVCGQEISENRLNALPFATRCTRCESAREAQGTTSHPSSRRGTNFGHA